jgi:PAS domain S-box-containing protein
MPTDRSATSETRRLHKRLRVLSNATRVFAEASRSSARLFDAVVHEVAESLQCACTLDLLVDDGEQVTTTRRHGPDVLQFPRDVRVKSALVVPWIVGGRGVGRLGLERYGDEAADLDEDDLALAESLAEQAGLALVTARRFEELERELAQREGMATRLRVLADASREFSEATGDYARLLPAIARRFAQIIGDLCAIRAVSEDGAWLEAGEVHHPDPRIVAEAQALLASHPQRVGEGFSGKVAATGQLLFVPTVTIAGLTASASPGYRQLIEDLRVGSIMVVPMVCCEKIVGVATLLRSGPDHPYTDDDLHLFRNIADHAALAIANARSYAAERDAHAAAVSARAALIEAQEAHRLLFDASPIPLLVFDVETLAVLAMNDATLGLYGYDRDEALHLDVSTLSIDGRDQTRARVVAAGEADAAGTVRQRRKDGSVLVVEYTTRALSFAGRRARIAVVKDVTARHEADQTRALLAAIVQSSNDAIISRSVEGTITSWNPTADRLFGYSAEEALGSPITIIVPPDRIDEARALLARVTSGERIEDFETIRRRKDGAEVAVSISIAPVFDTSGKVIGVSNTVRDLRAFRRAEEAVRRAEDQLRQAQKMEAVGRLAGGVAHDFNNILSVILSYSEMILAEMTPGEPIGADIEEIRQAGLRAAALTKQLLMFSRQQVLEPRVLDVNAVLAGLAKMLERVLGEDIDLVTAPSSGVGRIRADPSSVEQVIMNLVINARDAMPVGGRLTIETASVDLDDSYARDHLGVIPGPHVMLAVTDTGTGIDRATQARIFEPFFTTKEPGKGTGLGLSTVFGIAQQCGGSVWVYSEPGKGTVFKVYFPRVDASLDRTVPSRAPVTLQGSETILLVEDQEQVRAVARGILIRHGYQVLVAKNAGEALLLCEKHAGPIDLLVTDVVMPQMSGPELAKRLAVTRASMKVLCMSGYTDDSIVRHGVLESGMAFLQKPFTPESLTRKAREVLDAAPRSGE